MMTPKKTVLLSLLVLSCELLLGESSRPNFVLIVADDLGYGDIGCFGNTTIRTPNLDRLASQGVKLTHNIAADTLCTPSRAAFLTGRYPIRSGMASSFFIRAFMFTASAAGLPSNETTVAEVAKSAGYRTAFLGKWHQGWSLDRSDPDHPHPLNQGFEYFYGIPLTNMPDFDDQCKRWMEATAPHFIFQLLVTFCLVAISLVCLVRVGYLKVWLALPLLLLVGTVCGGTCFVLLNMKLLNSFMFRNYEIVEQPIHLPSVTRKLVKESEEWLTARHQDGDPFLLLLSWLHVHTALATAPAFTNRSAHGPYGDAVEEMDWGVGRVMEVLERYGMAHNTFVYFTSDHGGAPKLKDKLGRTVGGFNGPFSGAKAQGSTEGSFRVPGIVRWPAKLASGKVIDEPVSLMDILPTVAELLQVPASTTNRLLDGASLLPLLMGEESVSPHRFLFHYCQDSVHAVRYRPHEGQSVWKLTLREPNPNKGKLTNICDSALHLNPPKLYDLTSDPTTTVPLDPRKYPEVLSAMMKALREHKDSVTPVPFQFTLSKLMWQPWKQPCCNFPTCRCDDNKFYGLFVD